jgi:hypothetical protein
MSGIGKADLEPFKAVAVDEKRRLASRDVIAGNRQAMAWRDLPWVRTRNELCATSGGC